MVVLRPLHVAVYELVPSLARRPRMGPLNSAQGRERLLELPPRLAASREQVLRSRVLEQIPSRGRVLVLDPVVAPRHIPALHVLDLELLLHRQEPPTPALKPVPGQQASCGLMQKQFRLAILELARWHQVRDGRVLEPAQSQTARRIAVPDPARRLRLLLHVARRKAVLTRRLHPEPVQCLVLGAVPELALGKRPHRTVLRKLVRG